MPTLVVKRSKLRWLEKRGISKSVGKEANYDVSSSDHEFFHVASCSTSTTPIVERIDKIERKIIDGKLTPLDDDGKPLPNVVSSVNEDSDNEVENVVDEHAVFMASTGLKSGNDSGYGTNSLLEQCRSTKWDDDYDPYDDALYESHDISENLHSICGDFDITNHFLAVYDGKPLPNVVSLVNEDSDNEVENMVDEHAVFMASTSLKNGNDSGYGINNLLEQCRSTKQDDDYDPYDDDLYEIYDMFENLRLFVVILISRSMVGRRNRLILMFFESIVI
ncbi:hypothetical protein Tco_0697965 [Tanacetum coccineum]